MTGLTLQAQSNAHAFQSFGQQLSNYSYLPLLPVNNAI